MDLKSEFSRRIVGNKVGNIRDYIADFIRKHDIAFKGTTIALIASGTLLRTIALDSNSDNMYRNPILLSDISEAKIAEVIENHYTDNFDYSQGVKEKEHDIPKLKEEVETKPAAAQSGNDQIAKRKIIETVHGNEFSSSNFIEDVATDTQVDNGDSYETETSSKIYVDVKRKNGEILHLELEDYIIGVVAAEMPAEFAEEALKAQAIIARTYALKYLEKDRTLSDTEATQSYKDENELRKMWGDKYDYYISKIAKCASATEGLVLKYRGQYIECVYHSTSNGRTENAQNVWGNYFPYLTSVDSPYDTSNKNFSFETFYSYDEISQKLSIAVDNMTDFAILERTDGNRVKTVSIGETIFGGVRFRSLLGLRSADFEFIKTTEGVVIKTRGYGHGVGMSQYGANGMAKAGFNASEILTHYYQGVLLTHI